VQATAPASGVGNIALSIADGAYTSAAGVSGLGNSAVQGYGTLTQTAAATKVLTDDAARFSTDHMITALADGGYAYVVRTGIASSSYIQFVSKAGVATAKLDISSLYLDSLVTLNDGRLLVTSRSSTGAYSASIIDPVTKVIDSTVALYGSYVTNWFDNVSTTSLTNGGFVVASLQSDFSMALAIYDSNGSQVGSVKTFTTDTSLRHANPNVEGLSNGNFFLTYVLDPTSGSPTDKVIGQLYTAAGVQIGSDIVMTTSNGFDPMTAAMSNGEFVVTYADSVGQKIVFFNADGSIKNTVATTTKYRAAIDVLTNGNIVLTWVTDPNAPSGAVHSQIYDTLGNKVGSEYTEGSLYGLKTTDHTYVQALANGGYVLKFQAESDPYNYSKLVTFDALGAVNNTATTNGTNDVVNGSDNADVITANGGADVINAGGGDDTVIINESNVTSFTGSTNTVIDGGTGVNFLQLANASAATTLDMTNATVAARVKHFSSIDLTGTQNNTIKLNWANVASLSGTTDNTATVGVDESKMLVVSGNAGDAVQLADLSKWSVGASQTAASLTTTYGSSYKFLSGHTYKAYTLNGATLFVDEALSISNTTSTSPSANGVATNAVSVQTLFGTTFTDVDGSGVAAGTFKGVAITSAGTAGQVSANGAYEYSTDNGVTWHSLAGGLGDSTAVYLAKTDLVRYVVVDKTKPQQDLVARLVDNSGVGGSGSLASGDTVDTSGALHGGSTAFSGSTVTIDGVNDTPVAVADTASATEAGGTANGTAGTNPAGNVLTNDTDADTGDTKAVQDIKAGSGAAQTVTAGSTSANGLSLAGSYGTIVIGADGSYVYTVDNANATVQALNTSSTALTDTFTYTVKDAAGATSTATITVSVNGANDAPVVANAIADTTATVNAAFSYTVAANAFSDVDNASLTLSATLADGSALPSWLHFDPSTRIFSGTAPSTAGTVSVKVIANDGSLSTSDVFDVVVKVPNSVSISNASVNDTSTTTDIFGTTTQAAQSITYSDAVVSVTNYNGDGTDVPLSSAPRINAIGFGSTSAYLYIPTALAVGVPGIARVVKFASNVGNFTDLSFTYADLQDNTNSSNNSGYTGLAYAPVKFYDANGTLVGSAMLKANSAANTWSTFTWSGAAASYFEVTTTYDAWAVDNVGFKSAAGTLVNNSTTTDTTPTLNGTLGFALGTGDAVAVYEGTSFLGNATVTGTSWTFAVPTTSVGSHTYTAKIVNGGTAQASSSTFVVNVASTPLVLDLNGDGVQTVGVDQGVQFDLLNSGAKQQIGWVSKQDGLLAMDLNGDSQINSGAELFGDHTVLADGSLASDGWVALAAQDSNHDGVIDSNDASFSKLRVWVDANGNGVTDAGELHTLADEHIASINLAHNNTSVQQNGNVVQAFSTFTSDSGVTHAIADVGFQVQTTPSNAYSLSNGESIDLSKLSNVAEFKQIDMAADATANTIKLSLNDVLGTATTNGVHQLALTGDANDTAVFAANEWVDTGKTATNNGHTYEVYSAANGAAAQLLIDQHMMLAHNG
jgi:VCBS repeat-containing protein